MIFKRLKLLLVPTAAMVAAIVVLGGLYVTSPGVFAEESPDGATDGEVQTGDQNSEAMAAADGVVVVYRGTLQNEDGEPVSGVFPLTFKLYRGSMSAEPIWSETHFISAVDGRYQVALGYRSSLREHLLRGDRWIGIELDGEAEILRDRINVERPDEGVDEGQPAGSRVSHADVAERAIEAERARIAEDALTLDGMTAEEIEDMANLAMRRLGEHIADPDAHDVVTGPRVGSPSRAVDERAGGTGGSPYDIRCPDGQVVTGITGGAGRLVDSVTIVCSPLN